mgnify:CR=1 FL=1|jgi:hypothetical protein
MTDDGKRLNVRLTVSEHEALVSQARACGLSVSDFVRFRCLEDDGRPRIVVDTETLKSIYRDQRRIGGLLNQLLRHANARRQDFPALADQTQQAIEQLAETNGQISKLIADARTSA